MKFKWLGEEYGFNMIKLNKGEEHDITNNPLISEEEVIQLSKDFPGLVEIDGEVLDKAEEKKEDTKDGFHTCDKCGKEFDTPQGLASHKRSHKKKK
jgi:hypothetical protein